MARDTTDTTDTATRAASEWGIPDWRDAQAYSNVMKRRALVRWRWEFYRRNPDYRNEAMSFFAICEACEVAEQVLGRLKTPEARNRFWELADNQEQAFTNYWKRWGYIHVLDPRISGYPDEVLKTLPHDGFNIMDGSPSSEAGISSISPRIDQTAIVFDLGKPLAAQMEYAKRALKKRQKEHCGKLLQNRQHQAKWLDYLRTLDAREAGASWREIAELHPNTAQTEQTARDIWEAANALRFNF